MPKLNDYLGSIISSLSNARVMADIQTVKLAEDYAKHELLQHFSVPRMRIADVELDIPIAIESTQEELVENVDIINNQSFNKAIYSEITKNLGRTSLPRQASREVRTVLTNSARDLEAKINQTRKLVPVAEYSDKLASDITRIAVENKLIKNAYDVNETNLVERVKQAAEKMILENTQRTTLGDMNVIAETHLLREQKPENIVRIKMKITEDGMEWQKVEHSDGSISRKLLPE
jgi:hypothetical protein